MLIYRKGIMGECPKAKETEGAEQNSRERRKEGKGNGKCQYWGGDPYRLLVFFGRIWPSYSLPDWLHVMCCFLSTGWSINIRKVEEMEKKGENDDYCKNNDKDNQNSQFLDELGINGKKKCWGIE